jgi:hypothetical protein
MLLVIGLIILVDDRDRNLYHAINRGNSVFIPPFDPYGLNKVREITEGQSKKYQEDTVFSLLIGVCTAIVDYIQGCTPEEINDAFTTEPVFTQKKVDKMNLANYFKPYKYKKGQIKMLTLGDDPHFTNPDVFSTADAGGGRRRRTVKKRKRTTKKRLSNRRKKTNCYK